jgi:ketosteroid isomerase-like protein
VAAGGLPAVSEENVEVLRAGLEVINTGDVDRILEFVHPDFVVTVPQELSAEPDTYRGHEGLRRYFETFQEAMDDIQFDVERFWDTAGDHVVASFRLTARGKQTGIPVEQRAVFVWTLRDGQAIAVSTFASLDDALASVGLDERSPSVEAG